MPLLSNWVHLHDSFDSESFGISEAFNVPS